VEFGGRPATSFTLWAGVDGKKGGILRRRGSHIIQQGRLAETACGDNESIHLKKDRMKKIFVNRVGHTPQKATFYRIWSVFENEGSRQFPQNQDD